MTEPIVEKRRYTRIFFSGHEKIAGIISVLGNSKKTNPITVLNLSEGGLQISWTRDSYEAVQPEEAIILRQLEGVAELESLTDVSMKIKWVMDNEYLNNVIVGAVFVGLTEVQTQALQSFVKNWQAFRQGDEG